jgi:hypothetical protein
MDPGAGVKSVVNNWEVVFVLLGAPVPALFWIVNVYWVADPAPEYVNVVGVDVVSVRLAGEIPGIV